MYIHQIKLNSALTYAYGTKKNGLISLETLPAKELQIYRYTAL